MVNKKFKIQFFLFKDSRNDKHLELISIKKDKKRFDCNREVLESSLLLNTLFLDML